MGVGGEKPLQSLRDSFPTSGEATCPNCFRCRFPVLRGIGVYADAGEAGEGVFPLRSVLVPIPVTKKRCHSGRRSRSGTFIRKVHWGPRSALRFGGDDNELESLAISLLVIRHNPQAQIAQLLRGRQGWGAHHQVLGVLVHWEHNDIANVGGAS
jgi:hypothetical protein